jgi:hypothetical protein
MSVSVCCKLRKVLKNGVFVNGGGVVSAPTFMNADAQDPTGAYSALSGIAGLCFNFAEGPRSNAVQETPRIVQGFAQRQHYITALSPARLAAQRWGCRSCKYIPSKPRCTAVFQGKFQNPGQESFTHMAVSKSVSQSVSQ